MNDRIRKLAEEVRDSYSLEKWCCYAQAYGAHTTDWHESWFYSPEQEAFFSQYERQVLFGELVLVGTDDEQG